jgi:hypothetical protein
LFLPKVPKGAGEFEDGTNFTISSCRSNFAQSLFEKFWFNKDSGELCKTGKSTGENLLHKIAVVRKGVAAQLHCSVSIIDPLKLSTFFWQGFMSCLFYVHNS